MKAVFPMSMRVLATALLGASLLSAGCSSVNKLLGNEESIDYKSADKAPPSLQVPPDLTQLSREDRYQVPAERATTTFSTYNAKQGEQRTEPSASTVLPTPSADISVQRDGNQRWLVVNRPAEELYPIVREFWQDLGFNIRQERPEAGVMETDWAENRAKLPQDFIRNTIGKVLDSVYSTGELDKFRARLDRAPNGGTEIYITHQGMVETLTGADKTRTTWTARPSDPDLEAEFLRRLMVRLGSSIERAKASVDRPQEVAGRAAVKRVTGSGAAGSLQLTESFDRAWRSVGLAVDRGGFSVVDRDRSQGTYFVRYADPELGAPKEKGFFGRIFSFGGDNDPKAQPQYRIKLTGSGDATQIVVQNAQGGPETSRAGARILDVLADQLK